MLARILEFGIMHAIGKVRCYLPQPFRNELNERNYPPPDGWQAAGPRWLASGARWLASGARHAQFSLVVALPIVVHTPTASAQTTLRLVAAPAANENTIGPVGY